MAKCEGCVFDFRAAAVAVYKGFGESPAAGVGAIKHTIEDFASHLKEEHDTGYFKNGLKRGIDKLTGLRDLFWPGYDRPVGQSMRRNEGLLIVSDAPKEEVAKAREERKMWQDHLLPVILDLKEGEAVQFMALKSTTASDGVAFQQVSMKNGELILESQLMPFELEGNIDVFSRLVSEKGEDFSTVPAADVDPAVGWMVKGGAIDFKNELPQMIIESLLPEKIETMNWQRELNPVWPQLGKEVDFGQITGKPITVAAESTIVEEPVDRITSVEPSSFWWQLLTQQVGEVVTIPESVFKNPEIVVSEKNQVEAQPAKPILSGVVFETAGILKVDKLAVFKPQSTRKEEKKKAALPAKAKGEKPISVKSVIVSKSISSEETVKKTIDRAKKAQKKAEKGRLVSKQKVKAKKVEERIMTHVSKINQKKIINSKVVEKEAGEPKKVELQIPWWQINFEGIDDNDVPEMPLINVLWQYFNYLKELSWIVSIRQFALANTNWDQFSNSFIMVPVTASNHRGSGFNKKAILLEGNRGRKKIDTV